MEFGWAPLEFGWEAALEHETDQVPYAPPLSGAETLSGASNTGFVLEAHAEAVLVAKAELEAETASVQEAEAESEVRHVLEAALA